MIFIENFIFFIMNALSFKNDFGEKRFKFRLSFRVINTRIPGVNECKILISYFQLSECVHAVARH